MKTWRLFPCLTETQLPLNRFPHQPSRIPHPQFLGQINAMRFHRTMADVQFLSDLVGGELLDDEL